MSRRVTLPGADELFRAVGAAPDLDTGVLAVRTLTVAPRPVAAEDGPDSGEEDRRVLAAGGSPRAGVRRTPRPRTRLGPDRLPTGRQRHDEKITVYLSPEELVELERARLTLRQDHGLAVDRGRIVREALSLVLGEMDSTGADSALVRRLRQA